MLSALHHQCRIHARQQTLGGCLFVTRGAIDLACEEQTFNGFGFKRGFQRTRVEIIVFDRIPWPHDVRILQTFDGVKQFQLNIEWQRRRNTIRVILIGAQALGFQENLVRLLVRETMDFILDRWAVTGPHTFDHTGVHWASVQSTANNVVGFLVGVRDPARQLLRVHGCIAQIGKHGHGIEITWLLLHH